MMLPLVTIITPTFNRASYLDETIQSVLGQDYPHLDYLILDDGSTDPTADVLAHYQNEPRLRWQAHPNMGETRTVNAGFALARGEIIAVINSDDPLRPGAIRAAVECLLARPELLVAYPDWDRIGPKSELLKHEPTLDYDYATMLTRHECIVGPGAFFRKEAIDLIHGRNPQFRYVGDFDFWLRLGVHGPFARIPQTLATFREHPGSATTAARGAAMAREHIQLIHSFFAQPNLPPSIRALSRTALGRAHLAAAAVCGNAYFTKLKHCLCLALGHPRVFTQYLREVSQRLPIQGPPVLRLCRHVWDRFR